MIRMPSTPVKAHRTTATGVSAIRLVSHPTNPPRIIISPRPSNNDGM